MQNDHTMRYVNLSLFTLAGRNHKSAGVGGNVSWHHVSLLETIEAEIVTHGVAQRPGHTFPAHGSSSPCLALAAVKPLTSANVQYHRSLLRISNVQTLWQQPGMHFGWTYFPCILVLFGSTDMVIHSPVKQFGRHYNETMAPYASYSVCMYSTSLGLSKKCVNVYTTKLV